MEHYITLFDSLFLPQGLALHQSLERHANHYLLWVLCIDEAAYSTLDQLDLPNVRLLALADVETTELLLVKAERAVNEYCWTLTPFTPSFVFDADPTAKRATYLDADTWFIKDPQLIFDEFDQSGKGVLITEHAYSPECDETEHSGIYCVQFMSFCRDDGEPVRQWWQERCLEWCYNRSEDGKFGDQKYLDDWPERFPQFVHVLDNRQYTLAPWNALRFSPDEGVMWHFQALRIQARGSEWFADYGSYNFPRSTLKTVYEPYVQDLSQAIAWMQEAGTSPRPQGVATFKRRVKGLLTTTGKTLQHRL
ncbi:MAG: hypothetical protein ACJAWF_002484 [Candidatus Azotimanducaceae bacterium]|jgi:hypothetical protein